MSKELEQAIAKAMHWQKNATAEQVAAMLMEQRKSWIKGMAPCEHGDPDWETCPDCLADYFAKAAAIDEEGKHDG